jgi:hypothetical protein
MVYNFLKQILLLIFISPLSGFAQEGAAGKIIGDQSGNGNVVIHQNPEIDTLLKKHIQYNLHQDGIEGYRIHIFFDAGNQSLSRATQAARQFQTLYPGDTAYISFSEPYYRVRVGDFRKRMDAEGHLQKILSNYPNAFVIRDRINFPPLDD